MDSEKEFKDILNDKLGAKQFDFDADSWEQASAMLDASREEKKKRPVAWIFLSAAMLVVGGFAFYLFSSSEPSENTSVASAENKQSENTVVGNSVKKENATIENYTPENKTKKEDVAATVKNTSEKKEETSENKKEINTVVNTERKRPENSVAGKNTSEVKETSETSVTAKSENAVTVSETKIKAENSSVPVTVKKTKKNKTKKNQQSDASSSVAVNVKNTATKEPSETKNTTAAENGKTTKAQEPEVKNEPAVTKTETKDPENTFEGSSVPVATATVTSATSTVEEKNNTPANPVTETTVSVSETKSISKVDSAAATAQTPVKPPKVYNGTISLEGGINYFLGYKNPGKRDGKGYNPVAGINYSTRIYKRIGLTAGAQYYSVGQLSYSNHTSKVTRYRLGEESDVTVITPKTLHYIGFPVLFGFNFSDKHSFGIGCNVGYLMNVSGKVETYNENFKGISNFESSKTMGYTEGFRPFDTQLLLMYKRKIISDLYVNTGFVIGLSDIKDNAFFNSNVYERNLGVKVTLSYNLIKK